MSYVGKITISCPRRGHIVKRVKGRRALVVQQDVHVQREDDGSGCTIVSREIVKKAPSEEGTLMARDPKGFRLSFTSTTAKKFAPTMKAGDRPTRATGRSGVRGRCASSVA